MKRLLLAVYQAVTGILLNISVMNQLLSHTSRVKFFNIFQINQTEQCAKIVKAHHQFLR
jgi:hypothetical protein